MTLQDHEAKKPVRSKPIKDMTPPEYKQWSEAMSVWLWERDGIIASEAVKGMDTPLDHRSKVMMERACTPRADYEYREPMPRKRNKATRPAWAGPEERREYFRQKKEESRAKVHDSVQDAMAQREKRRKHDRAYKARKRAERQAAKQMEAKS